MYEKILAALSAVSGVAIISGGAAVAGGYVPLTAQPEAVVIEQQPATFGDWAGAYVGAALGYALISDDVVGLDSLRDNGSVIHSQNELGSADMTGVNLGAHLGYRWQVASLVFGPELAIEGGAIEGDGKLQPEEFHDAFGVDSAESKLNYLIGLRMKAGVITNPETLVYGTLGLAYADIDYTLNKRTASYTENFSDTGVTAGLGVERKLSEKLSVYGEWEYRYFSYTDVTFDEINLRTRATPEHHNLKIGVNYRF